MKIIIKNIKLIISITSLILVIFLKAESVSAWGSYAFSIPYEVDIENVSRSVSLTSNLSTVLLPQNSVELTWITVGPHDACTATSTPSTSWTRSRSPNGGGPETVTSLTAGNYLFVITCSKSGEQDVSSQVLVLVRDNLPDLISSSVAPNTATVGVPVSFSGMVTNAGSKLASGPVEPDRTFPAFFQISSSADGTGAPIVDLSPSNLSPLSADASIRVSSPSYIFSSPGTYSVRLCADKSSAASMGVVVESNELNNCGHGWTKITVIPPPVITPSVTLSAAPQLVISGTSSVLSWTSQNVTSCTASAVPASGAWSGTKFINGNESTGALTSSKTFTIACTGSYGTVSATATVTVVSDGDGGGISVTLTATPDRISVGDSSVLQWGSTGATSCTSTDFATGGATSGTVSVSPVVTTRYYVRCTDGTSTGVADATVWLKRKFLFIEI